MRNTSSVNVPKWVRFHVLTTFVAQRKAKVRVMTPGRRLPAGCQHPLPMKASTLLPQEIYAWPASPRLS